MVTGQRDEMPEHEEEDEEKFQARRRFALDLSLLAHGLALHDANNVLFLSRVEPIDCHKL